MAELNHHLIALLAARAKDTEGEAFLQKRLGVWHRYDWARIQAEVLAVSSHLRAGGFKPGESIAIISGARIEAVIAVYACQHAGLRPVMLNPNIGPGAVATFFEDGGCVAIVTEDQEQLDKVADMQSRLSTLRHVWIINPKGVAGYSHIRARPFAELLKPSQDSAHRSASGTDAVGLFTSGVHGEPRLVSVAHATLMKTDAINDSLAVAAGQRVVSLFGLADALGFFFGVVAPLLFRIVPCFGEDRLPSVPEMRQCAPHVLASPARLLDRLRRETTARINRSGRLSRNLIRQWSATRRPGPVLRALVGEPISRSLGLNACKLVACGYDRLSNATADFLSRLSIRSVGLYSLAEAGGPVAIFDPAHETAFRCFRSFPVSVSAARELAVQVNGTQLATGDLAAACEGGADLLGRAADLLTLPEGRLLAPSSIEAELMASPYVNQAVAVGGPAGGVTALIELDEVTLRDWARARSLPFTTLRSFAESTQVQDLIGQAVRDANQNLPECARVMNTELLPRALDPGNGELTPALALRRSMIRNRYSYLLAKRPNQNITGRSK